MTIKLLIADDSAFMRRILEDLILDMKDIELVGIAKDGLEVLEILPKLNVDLIVLDIEMPRLNGLDTLKQIKRRYDIPVIILSSISDRNMTIEALDLGAEEFLEKPKNIGIELGSFKNNFEETIKSIVCKSPKCDEFIEEKEIIEKKKMIKDLTIKNKIDALVIASSTGGPKALVNIFSNIKENLDIPIFIVQHMPPGFTKTFAERLDRESPMEVVEAKNNMDIVKNKVYVAPGDYHMYIENNKIILDNKMPKLHGVRPAADYLFESASKKYKNRLLSLVLTGMGKDGAMGSKYIKDLGGYNIVQNEQTCVVYGMPSSCVKMGTVDDILSLEEIPEFLIDMVKGK